MQSLFRVAFLFLALCAAGSVRAQSTPPASGDAAPVYRVTYFEAGPAAADAVAGTLRQFAADSHKETGNLEFTALREVGRPNRFAFVEAWRDKAGLESHQKAVSTLIKRLQAQLAAPFDTRPSTGFLVGPASASEPAPGATYVLTHVDVPPPSKDECIALLRKLTETSRGLPGVLRFDVLQQDSRPNHFTLVHAWRDRGAFDAAVMTETLRDFRQKLLPIEGALYDERVYESVR